MVGLIRLRLDVPLPRLDPYSPVGVWRLIRGYSRRVFPCLARRTSSVSSNRLIPVVLSIVCFVWLSRNIPSIDVGRISASGIPSGFQFAWRYMINCVGTLKNPFSLMFSRPWISDAECAASRIAARRCAIAIRDLDLPVRLIIAALKSFVGGLPSGKKAVRRSSSRLPYSPIGRLMYPVWTSMLCICTTIIGSGICSQMNMFMRYAISSASARPAPHRNGEYSCKPLAVVSENRDGGIVFSPYMYFDSQSQSRKSAMISFRKRMWFSWKFGSRWTISGFSSSCVRTFTAARYPCPSRSFSRSRNRSMSRLGRNPRAGVRRTWP